MKVYEVSGTEVSNGISVVSDPYSHIVLGEGGHKRATWVALGKRDADSLIQRRRLPCPLRGDRETVWQAELPVEKQGDRTCVKCGLLYGHWQRIGPDIIGVRHERRHPDAGEVDGPACVFDAGVIALKDGEGKPNGKYLIVAPRPGVDDRILVLWRVSSGYRGSSNITAGEGVAVIACDSSWHSGRGNLGETAEMLAVLNPGQELFASRSGRNTQDTRGRLQWDGKKISVIFGGEELFAATAEDAEGEYL